VEPNKHVELHIHYINTTIVVRQIGRYFTFAIRMPRQLVNGLGEGGVRAGRHSEPELCVKGCPASERIDYKQYLADRRDHVTRIQSQASGLQVTMTRQEAEETCRDSGLVDFYFDSCVFDLMATGDRNFTLAALSALRDVMKLDPSAARFSNRTSLQLYDDVLSAAQPRTVSPSWLLVLCTVYLCLTLWRPLLPSLLHILTPVR
jgi:RGM family protein